MGCKEWDTKAFISRKTSTFAETNHKLIIPDHMNIKHTQVIAFSPTRTSLKVARAIARGWQGEALEEVDLTCRQLKESLSVNPDCVAVVAVPVYAGRVAPLALHRLRRVKGEGAPVILLAVYGNRDYEDALVELRDVMTAQGFVPLAAGAFIGEHSYSRPGMPVAEGRPDTADLQAAEDFGRRARLKCEAAGAFSPFFIKGNVPYREVGTPTPQAPVWREDDCAGCGTCMDVCPTQSIRMSDEGEVQTEPSTCIKCCACVKSCPAGALVFDTPYTAMLHTKFGARREPETFL